MARKSAQFLTRRKAKAVPRVLTLAESTVTEDFKAYIRGLASTIATPDQVFAYWQEYCRDCQSYDQSPVKSEFENWYRPKLMN